MPVSIEAGCVFSILNVPFTVKSVNQTTGQYEVIGENGLWRIISKEEFSELYRSGALRLSGAAGIAREVSIKASGIRPIKFYTKEEQEVIQYRLGYIKSITDQNQRINASVSDCEASIKEHARSIGETTPARLQTIRRWQMRYAAAGWDLTALLPRTHRRGNRCARLDPKTISAMDDVIHSRYLTTDRRTIRHVYENYLRPLFDKGGSLSTLPMPSYKSFCQRISDLDAYVLEKARYGYHHARNRFPSGRKVPRPTFALEVIEIDHTPIDITLIDTDGKTIKRVFATFAIDKYSRMIVGFHISMRPVSKRNVLETIRHAILPKDYIKKKYPFLKHEWPCFGIFSQILTDNGMELHAADVKRIVASLGIDITYCIKKMPTLKGSVERFIHTFNYVLIHHQPGTTFSNFWKRGDYASEKEACLTFEQLTELIHRWIVDDYHVRIHRGLGDTPLNVWSKSVSRFVPPRLPDSIEEINKLLWEKSKRRLQKYGVELFGLKYNSPALMDLAKKHDFSTELDVYHDPSNIGRVYIAVPETEEFIEADYENAAYVEAGISLDEHEEVKRQLRKKHGEIRDYTDHLLIEARRDLREMVESAASKKNRTKRTRRHAMDQELRKTSAAVVGDVTTRVSEQKPIDDEKVGSGLTFVPMTIDAQYT